MPTPKTTPKKTPNATTKPAGPSRPVPPKNPSLRPLPNQPQPAKPSRETLPGKPGKPTQENLPYKPAPAKPSFPKNFTPTTPSGLPPVHKATPAPNRAGARRGQPLK